MTTDETRTVAELLKEEQIAVFTTTAPDGTLMSRPMALQEVEFDGDLWLIARRSARKITHVAAQPQVNVATAGSDSRVPLTGHAVVIDDLAKKQKLWNTVVDAWSPRLPGRPGGRTAACGRRVRRVLGLPRRADRHGAQRRHGPARRPGVLRRGARPALTGVQAGGYDPAATGGKANRRPASGRQRSAGSGRAKR
jgi:general stress protein 26